MEVLRLLFVLTAVIDRRTRSESNFNVQLFWHTYELALVER